MAATSHEILPGESIGAFRLGMTRAEVDALGIQPRRVLDDKATYFPLTSREDALVLDDALGAGVTVFLTRTGKLSRLRPG